jgi:aspartyl-tRNA(Asn)/glutamyl-tRNA(Gln) amidotransferase subunit C
VAELARLELTDSELQTFTSQLGQIVGYVDQLQEVDITGVEPLALPFPADTPLREDVVVAPPKDSEGNPKTLVPAPETLDGGFKVPPIL